MCGGLSDSQKYWRSKNAQIESEMKRLSRLVQGYTYNWPLSTGLEKHKFGGHCRSENLESVWNGKIERHVKIEASEFYERDTIGGSMELRSFSVPADKRIHGVITSGELRIVTVPANEAVRKIHNRMPELINI